MTHKPTFIEEHNAQVMLSQELLTALKWVMTHESQQLKLILARCIASRSYQQMRKNDSTQLQTSEDAHAEIVDFFKLIESLLLEVTNEHSIQKAFEKNLLPAIDQIDNTVCDMATIQSSVEKATSSLEHADNESAHEILFKELLKQWKPLKKEAVN